MHPCQFQRRLEPEGRTHESCLWQAFTQSHRWAADYRVVLNLEAIGAGEPRRASAKPFASRPLPASDARQRSDTLNTLFLPPGGPSVVFQLGPEAAWLASALGRSKHSVPRGTVIAHDLFQVPGFPAATDFKTLLAHAPNGSAPPVGLDMATLGNGYVYHTPLDASATGSQPAPLAAVTAALQAADRRAVASLPRSNPVPRSRRASSAALSCRRWV